MLGDAESLGLFAGRGVLVVGVFDAMTLGGLIGVTVAARFIEGLLRFNSGRLVWGSSSDDGKLNMSISFVFGLDTSVALLASFGLTSVVLLPPSLAFNPTNSVRDDTAVILVGPCFNLEARS